MVSGTNGWQVTNYEVLQCVIYAVTALGCISTSDRME